MTRFNKFATAVVAAFSFGAAAIVAAPAAKAQTHGSLDYKYGYTWGLVVNTCSMYRTGAIGHSDFTGFLEIASNLDETPTRSINRKILSNFVDMKRRNKPLAFCRPVVQRIFTEAQAPSPYQSADLLY